MRIIEFRVENFKRITAIAITPDRHMVHITGKNGAGKSAILDSIQCVFAGKRVIPVKPIREGANEATVVVEVGEGRLVEYIIKRTWTSNDRTYLTVTGKDGRTFPSPQALLDELVGELSFDPLAFVNMSSVERVKILAKICGVDLDKFARDRGALVEARKTANSQKRMLDAQLRALDIYPLDTPDEPIVVKDLIERKQAAEHFNAEIKKQQSALSILKKREQALLEKSAKLEAELATAIQEHAETKRQAEEMEPVVSDLSTVDLSNFDAQILAAQDVNAAVGLKVQHLNIKQAIQEAGGQLTQLDRNLRELNETRDQAIAAAPMPIDNLRFDETGVTLDKTPFDQCCSEEQLDTSVAIGMALNPKLRLMLIRQGSLLDTWHLSRIEQWAERNDMQIWIECVTDGEDVGIVIEEGCVKSDGPAPICATPQSDDIAALTPDLPGGEE